MHEFVRTLAVVVALSLLAGDTHAADSKAKAKPKPPPKPKVHTFHGMVVLITGSGAAATVEIKHANGAIKSFLVDGKTRVGGHGVNALAGLMKGQVVKVHHAGHHAGKVDVVKQAPANPVLSGKKEVFKGKVEKVHADKFGENGHVWVKDATGTVKQFAVHNETNIDYKQGDQTITHTLQGVGKGMHVTVRHRGKDATHIHVVMRPATFHGMIVQVTGADGSGSLIVKHANGTGKGFHVDGKTTIAGHGVTAFSGLKKGQVVKVDHFGRHATAVAVHKEAAANPKLTGMTATLHGTVEKVVADRFGDNGQVWVKDSKGVVTKFHVHNETNIDYQQDGKTIVHTLQGVGKGMKVNVKSVGKDAVHIDVVMD